MDTGSEPEVYIECPFTPLTEAEAEVSQDEQHAAAMFGYDDPETSFLMSLLNGEDSFDSEIIPPFDQQHDWPMQEDVTLPLARSLDLLLDLDLSDLSRLTAVSPPLSPPAMDRLLCGGVYDPGNLLTCFWADERTPASETMTATAVQQWAL